MDTGNLPPEAQKYIAQLERGFAESSKQVEELKHDNKALERDKKALEHDNKALGQVAQQTTFNTFLKNCHIHLSVLLKVRTRNDTVLASDFTSPKDRYCPTHLKEWREFHFQQRNIFKQVSAIYHPDQEAAPKPFPEILFLKRLGQAVESRELTSENDLRVHERSHMEDMVTRILDNIVKREALEEYDLDQGVVFENHTNNLSTSAPEVQARLEEVAASSSSDSDSMPKPTNADQFSVVKRSRGGDTVSFLVEYKSPYKLPKDVLREGISPDLDMQKIINRAKYSTDPEQKFTETAEDAVAAVITQLYSYMLQAGIEYGYLSTGKNYLFLRISYRSPEVVYYHLAEPNVDVNNVDRDEELAYSAIGQVLCFCLRASKSTRRNQQWRRNAKSQSLKWAVNVEKVLAQMTPIKEKAEPPQSDYKPSRRLEVRPAESSNRTSSRLQALSRTNCNLDPVVTRHDPESSSDEQLTYPESPSARARPTGSKATKATDQARAGRDNAGEGHKHNLPYCTHKCLQGVAQRGRLDPECPNRALHPSTKRLRHTIDAATFSTLLRNQLDSDMDHNCTPLGIQGARGALFKLTLASHGYTLIGKGTVRAFARDLRHEGGIYRQIRTLQGTVVPVCLGNIDCIYPYDLDIDVEIVHFLLLSWAGLALDFWEYADRKVEVIELENKLRALGVEHEDQRCYNVLRDQQHGQLMLIDFERATTLQAKTGSQAGQGKKGAKVPLGETSSNVPMKRRWEVDATGDVIGLKVGGQAPGHDLYHSLSI